MMKGNELNNKAGIDVVVPPKECGDRLCPFHGHLKLHGRIFKGQVTRDVFHKTATIEFEILQALPKYERFIKKKSRIKAHVPPCMDLHKGDVVRIMETRPISKTKNFVVVEGGRT